MGNICDAHRLRGILFFVHSGWERLLTDGDCWEKQEKGGLSMNGPITVLLDCISFLFFLKVSRINSNVAWRVFMTIFQRYYPKLAASFLPYHRNLLQTSQHTQLNRDVCYLV